MLTTPKGLKIFSAYNEKLVFNTSDYASDLQGSLAANVKFAQSQIIPATVKPGDKQPRLIANRKTLLLVKPLEEVKNLQVTVIDKEGKQAGVRQLNRPELLPPTAYQIDNVPADVNFEPLPGAISKINTIARVNQLNQPDGSLLLNELRSNSVVEIETADGRWVRDIYFPSAPEMENKVIRIASNAGYNSDIHYSGRKATLSRDNAFVFKYVSGQWIWENELANQGIIYALNTWSIELPASWVQPGMSMRFESGEKSGQLKNIQVGAPTELLIHTIDIGMLTPPLNRFTFANDAAAHREYFQTAPIAKMTVAQYQPVHLTEVMLPDGRLLTDVAPGQGGMHEGIMRQHTSKELISLGINHANYGINSSEGQGEWSPYMAAQLTAHNSRGRYDNGVIIHGMSGGKGMVTLYDSLGNEFSHEVGHCYDLIHYPGGFDGSVHQSANSVNSTWGWDSDLGKFLPNFRPAVTGQPSCYEGTCQASFHGRSFGFDPMAGGEPMAPLNRFTLYTPYTASQIQQFMEEKVVFATDSATGFKKWNKATQRMEPFFHHADVLHFVTAANRDLSESMLADLFASHKTVMVTMADGNWAQSIPVPAASQINKGAVLTLIHNATFNSQLHINGQTINISRGFNKSYYSDGLVWKESIIINADISRTWANNEELDQLSLATLFSHYRLVNIIIDDSNPAQEISVPPATENNRQCILNVENNAPVEIQITINGLRIMLPAGEKAVYLSNGDRWLQDVNIVDISRQLKPEQFGVPVTTLVGYYDPQNLLPGYIFPALHGAYGFTYQDNLSEIAENDCQLVIESANGTKRFKLHNHRFRANVMNKFHINIAESDRPRTASLICNGEVVFSCDIAPVEAELTYTINGESSNENDDSNDIVAPRGLRVTNTTADSISLAWDSVLLPNQGYIVYRNGKQHRIISSNTFTDTGLVDNTQYTYAVSTLFIVGSSPVSQPVTAKTLPLYDLSVPPANFRVTGTTTDAISLAWEAMPYPVAGYLIRRDGNVVNSTTGLSFTDSGLPENTQFSYVVSALYRADEESAATQPLEVSTKASAVPDMPPSAPGNLRSTAVTESTVSLAWDASVAGSQPLESYSIFRNENAGVTSVVASVPASQLSWSDSGLKADTRYNYFAIAYDVSGKMSARSNTLAVTTLPQPEVAPSAPGNLRSTAVTESTVSLAWDASVAGSQPLESYSIFRNENGGVTSVVASVPASQLSWSDSGLKADTRYNYFAIAYDVSGKMSARSNTLIVTTDSSSTLRTWALGETFQTGEQIAYQGKIWVCIQGHTAWVADWAPGGADSATLWRLA